MAWVNRSLLLIGSALASTPSLIVAEPQVTHSYNMWGVPGGLLDMPTSEMAPDGELATAVTNFAGITRTTLSFQVMPRLTASFRYSALNGYRPIATYTHSAYFDRSFDLRYQFLTEGKYRPAMAIGLQDFIGTGNFGGEYIVATKTIGKRLRFTAGIGWGRLGSFDSLGTTGARPNRLIGAGGELTSERWFKGPYAAFGGVSYQVNDRINLKAEYSSDAYSAEMSPDITNPSAAPLFQRKSPWNFGIDYKVSNSIRVGASYMYGSEFGLNVVLAMNPKHPRIPGGTETAPVPVSVRNAKSARDLGWSVDNSQRAKTGAGMIRLLQKEGLVAEAVKLSGTEAKIILRNTRYDIETQAVGRAARVMSRALPASVETFTIAQSYKGVPVGAVTLRRSDIERLENAPASTMLSRVAFTSGKDLTGLKPVDGAYPRLSWSLGPYAKMSVFEPSDPAKADFGIKLAGDYYLAPGWVASGSVSVKLAGNIDKPPSGRTGFGPGTLPQVRSNARQYSLGNDPRLDYLTIANYARPGKNLYSRVTLGYLETMYAGISGEVLWKPVNSRLAIGAEVNYVAQRDFDQGFGVQDYKIATGHVSAYYDIGHGFHGQLDVGRYLAGDWGATLSVDREFANGWKVGAYVTRTNVSATAFGEGSFDKGIRITIPMSWALSRSSRKQNNVVIQSLNRDGGAKLNVNGRLYNNVRDLHKPEMAKTWGRFWR